MRHRPQLIADVVKMRASGFTLGEIVARTGLSKTTIFYHIQTIPKSDTLLKKLRTIALENQKSLSAQRRGKSIKAYSFARPLKWNADFVSLIAHLNFDGDIRHSSANYNNRNIVLIEKVKKYMGDLLNVDDFKIYKNSRSGVLKLCYFNVEIASFVKQKSEELWNYIPVALSNEKISFLQAFFDDEGCITFENKKRLIRGYQHSIIILKIVQKLLSDFGIQSNINEKYFEIIISKKENLLKFQQLINFTPGVCVNGNRSNSIWKKSLEKREILNQAVNSYLT